VHDAELDGDEGLAIGMRIEVCDESGRMFAATVTDRVGSRWQLTFRRAEGQGAGLVGTVCWCRAMLLDDAVAAALR
jgi:hypothetical protein